MQQIIFEKILDISKEILSKEAQKLPFKESKAFENRVREVLLEQIKSHGEKLDLSPHPHIFPDIVIGHYGVEVKFTTNDTWRSVANSVFEGTRSQDVRHIYVMFGKMGGVPEVRWGKYAECIMHVRTSHVPRFEVEMNSQDSLFKKMGVTYDEFHILTPEDKMKYIRKYARGRLKNGERLWWLEDKQEQDHTLPIQVQLYMNLPQHEKRRYRAESALLCPQIVKPSRTKNKYNDVTLYLLTYHGVLCPQARDLFSAGSVALRSNSKRGGNYIMRALLDIEAEMIEASRNLEDALFQEYWEEAVPINRRIDWWLAKADEYASGWKPSELLFQKRRK